MQGKGRVKRMADQIRVNTGRMKQDVDNIMASVNQISMKYTDLIQKKAELDTMWDGPASESFKKVTEDDMIALATVIGNLKKVYEYENIARERYEQCENRISGEIAGI